MTLTINVTFSDGTSVGTTLSTDAISQMTAIDKMFVETRRVLREVIVEEDLT